MINNIISSEKVALVITPPELYGTQLAHRFRARTTLGVLTQLIAQAETHIVVASPFLQSYEGLTASPFTDALKHALQRGVHLDVIVTGVGIDIFKKKWTDLLGDGGIRLFQPKPNVDDDKLLGSHAKILIADGQHAYIGSANLTHPGLVGNLEMGVLVHGNIAVQAASFLEYLMDIEFLVQIPI